MKHPGDDKFAYRPAWMADDSEQERKIGFLLKSLKRRGYTEQKCREVFEEQLKLTFSTESPR